MMKTELKTVISLDSFKGSLGSVEAGEAVREGILREFRERDITIPLNKMEITVFNGGQNDAQ